MRVFATWTVELSNNLQRSEQDSTAPNWYTVDRTRNWSAQWNFKAIGLSVLCMEHQLFKILTLVIYSHYSYSTTFSKVNLATVIRLWRSGILATQCRWAIQDCIASDQPGPACSAFGSPAHESPHPQHRPLCLTVPLWFLDLSRVAPKTKHIPYPPQGQPTTTSSSPPPSPQGSPTSE